MTSVEEVRRSIERRLEELLAETDQLRAAITALDADAPDSRRATMPRRATGPAQPRASRRIPAKAGNERAPASTTGRSMRVPGAADAREGDDHAPSSAGDRALSELRRELAAGLRTRP